MNRELSVKDTHTQNTLPLSDIATAATELDMSLFTLFELLTKGKPHDSEKKKPFI